MVWHVLALTLHEGESAMLKLIQKIKVGTARALARLFYWIYDPQIESQIGDRRDYEYYQSQRRRNVENYLAKYLGPKL
jgi:hypothetical protein